MQNVAGTAAGQQLQELSEGPHGDEKASRWQEDLAPKRLEERGRTQREERDRTLREAVWEQFMKVELQELELRRNGQLARLLDGMQVSTPEALRRLAAEDQKQAEKGLVALAVGGNIVYKQLSDLIPEDRPARIAADRARTTWLKERRDRWTV